MQGTEEELNAQFPDASWKRVARPARPQTTRQKQDDSAILTLTEDMDYADDPRPGRLPSSSRRYFLPEVETAGESVPEKLKRPVPPRRSALLDESNPRKTRIMKPHTRFDRWALITWLCLAVIVMVAGWFLFSKVANWWTGVEDNFKYGTPFRTFQADQYMAMGDTPDHPDHFIALNLHGVIEVVQIDPLDRKKDAVYVLANIGDESTPVSLSFKDTTGSGHVDVIVTIGDTTPYAIILINNGTTLTPTQPAH